MTKRLNPLWRTALPKRTASRARAGESVDGFEIVRRLEVKRREISRSPEVGRLKRVDFADLSRLWQLVGHCGSH